MSSYSQDFQKTISTDTTASIESMTNTSDGGFIVGVKYGGLIKFDVLGNIEWSKKYIATPIRILQCDDKGYIFSSNLSDDILIVKTDSIGNLLWAKTYGGLDEERSISLISTKDKGYVVTGYTKSYGVGDKDFYLIKIDSIGNQIWTKTYGTTAPDIATDIYQTNDKGFVILGNSMDISEQVAFVKIDSIGNIVWSNAYYNTVLSYSGTNKLVSVNDNNYVLLCSFGSIDGSYGHLICIDSIGNELWNRGFGFEQIVSFNDIIVDNKGNYLVSGYWENPLPFYSPTGAAFLLKFDKNGNYIWGKEYGYNGRSAFNNMIYHNSGLIMAGSIILNNNSEIDGYIIKTDTNSSCDMTYPNSYSSLNSTSLSLTTSSGGIASDTVFSVMNLSIKDSSLYCYCEFAISSTISNASCKGCSDGTASITSTGGKEPYAYLWDINADNQTTSVATGLSAGTYYVTVTDSNNCISKTNVTINDTLVNIPSLQTKIIIIIQLYPNPSDGNFDLQLTTYDLRLNNAALRIYNVLGEIVYQQTLNSKQETLNTKLTKGVYLLQLQSEEGVWNEKVIVQ